MFRLLLLHKIEDSRFQSAETEIKSGYLRFGKYKRFGVPVLGIAVDQRSARIRKSKDFGRFVERFARGIVRSEEHTSELQSLMRISYAVFCLKKKKTTKLIDYKN